MRDMYVRCQLKKEHKEGSNKNINKNHPFPLLSI